MRGKDRVQQSQIVGHIFCQDHAFLRKEEANMVKLVIIAVLLAGVSTYALHSERASATASLPATKFDQLNTEANVSMRSFHLPQVNGKVAALHSGKAVR
jgi:hypothetical protein